jgi:hypothetical protein
VKDGDNARNLVAVVMGQGCVAMAMVGVGFLWAMVKGRQLTLTGMAVAPFFVGAMARYERGQGRKLRTNSKFASLVRITSDCSVVSCFHRIWEFR